MLAPGSRVIAVTVTMLGACGDSAPAAEAESSGSETSSSSTSTSTSDVADTSDASTSSTDTTAESSSTGDPEVPLPECPTFARGEMAGTVADAEIVEASGLVTSRMHDGVLWVHNDSGDGARVFAIDREGETLAEIAIADTIALDWEDMAIGPGPEAGVDYLYFGDIGDNGEIRATITVYRIPEPDPAEGDATVDDVTPIVLDYPDGSHNAETLLVDPITADILVVTKARSGMSGVFVAPAPHEADVEIDMELIGTLGFGSALLPGDTLATGGDISADGSLVAVRTYDSAFAWRRAAGATLAEAFATDPCPLPTADDIQGETLALAGDGMLTISEGESQPIWFFARRE